LTGCATSQQLRLFYQEARNGRSRRGAADGRSKSIGQIVDRQAGLLRGGAGEKAAASRDDRGMGACGSQLTQHLPNRRGDLSNLFPLDRTRDCGKVIVRKHLEIRAHHAREPGSRFPATRSAAVRRLAGITMFVDMPQPEMNVRRDGEMLGGDAAGLTAESD